MAYPDDQIRSLIDKYALADPLDDPFLKMKTERLMLHGFDVHALV